MFCLLRGRSCGDSGDTEASAANLARRILNLEEILLIQCQVAWREATEIPFSDGGMVGHLAGPAGDSVCILPVNLQVMTFSDPC